MSGGEGMISGVWDASDETLIGIVYRTYIGLLKVEI